MTHLKLDRRNITILGIAMVILFAGYLLTIGVLIVYSLLLFQTGKLLVQPISNSLLFYIINVFQKYLLPFIVGFFIGRKIKKNGFVYGALAGFIYSAIGIILFTIVVVVFRNNIFGPVITGSPEYDTFIFKSLSSILVGGIELICLAAVGGWLGESS